MWIVRHQRRLPSGIRATPPPLHGDWRGGRKHMAEVCSWGWSCTEGSVPKVIVEENAFCQLVTFICNICFSPKTILRKIQVHWSCLVNSSYMTICILGHCQRFVMLPLCCEDLLMCYGFQRMCLSLSFASLSNKQRLASSPSSHGASTHKGFVQNERFFLITRKNPKIKWLQSGPRWKQANKKCTFNWELRKRHEKDRYIDR